MTADVDTANAKRAEMERSLNESLEALKAAQEEIDRLAEENG
jgi:hypothetical protein